MALGGCRVVVTRPVEAAANLVSALKQSGAVVLPLPVIEIRDPESWDDLDEATRGAAAGEFDWVVFTSGAAARRFVGRAEATGAGPPVARVAAVGEVTAAFLERAGIAVDGMPEDFTGQSLAAVVGPAAKVLYPRVAHGPDTLVRRLQGQGCTVTEVVAYRNEGAQPGADAVEAVRRGAFDVVTFASGSAVKAFVRLVAAPGHLGLVPGRPTRKITACLGPVTARVAEQEGFRVDVVARPYTVSGLLAALALAWSSHDESPEMAP